MAVYRLEAKVISRAKGRSATASAAYRAASLIEDERTGQTFDYTKKRGVLHSEILTPDGTPDWMTDRAMLWNAVEKVEKRRDSQLARDFILSLPHELTHGQRVELLRDFLRTDFVAQGMIADFSVHAPDRQSDQRNHHAHVMVTMRELTAGGFGLKVREWNATEQLEAWRERWADTVNRHLEQHGHEARVDHRSLEDQGIDREPEPKQGPVATEMEHAGRASHAGDDRRAVQEHNRERENLASEIASIETELRAMDSEPSRDRKSGDGRDDHEQSRTRRRILPSIATTDGSMVAQQAEAMRRFKIHSARLEERRAQQSKVDFAQPISLDGGAEISRFSAGNEERPDMVSKYDHLRAEQSKATPDQAVDQSPDPAHQQSPQPNVEISEQNQARSAGLKWSMDQSMPAQNAAANAWAKASHEHRQEQANSRDGPSNQEDRDVPAEPDRDNQQAEPQLRFADRDGDRNGRIDLKREQSEAEPSKDESGERQLRFSEERGGERSGRIDLKREQSEAQPSRDSDSDRKLNLSRERNQSPNLDR